MPLTQEQNDRVRRKIDRVILPLLVWVYVSRWTCAKEAYPLQAV